MCDNCGKPTSKLYNVNDEGFCEDCMNDAIDRAEMAYESQREDGLNL
jgi:hypothetical protein